VSANAWWTIGRPAFLLAMRLDGADAAALSRWAPSALQSLDGRLTATVMARQQGSTLTAAGSADLARPVILGTALDAAAAAFRVDERGVTVDRAYVRQGPAWALANGHIAPQGTLTLSAYGGAIDLTRLSDLGLRLDLAGHSDFAGRISGPWNAPELAGTLQVSKGRILGVAFDAARSTLALRRGRLAVSSLVARAGRARYRAAGTVEWQSPARLGLDIEAERASAATLTHLARLPFSVSGVVDGRLRVDGPASQPSVAGVMTLRDAIVSGQKVEEAAATFRWDGIRFSLERASVRRGRSVIDVAGTIDRRTGFALDVASQALDLRDLTLPPLGATLDGRIALTGRITGQPSAPTIALSARSSDLLVNGIRFEHTEGRVEWTPRTVRLDPVLLRHGDERYQITGEVGLNGPPSVRLTADVTDGRLSTLLGLANARLGVPLDGTVSGLATIEGPVANPAARLDIRMTRGRFGDHPLVEGHADLTLRDGAVTIEEFQVRPLRGVIAAQGRLNLRGESQVEVGGTDLDLDILRPLLRLRRPLVGQLNFTTQLGGTLASPEIGFALELVRAGLEGATFDSLVANAFYRDGLLQVQQALLTQNGHKLRASGSLPFNPALLRFDPQRPVDFRLGLSDVNLSLLRLITDRVEDAVGAVEGEVRITGSITAPHTSGGVQVRDGRVRIRGLQTPLESLRLDLRFEENAIRVAEGSARVGGGLARLQGGARVVQMAGPSLALVIAEDAPLVLQGTEMRIVVRPYVDARFDGTARLRGTLGDPRRPLTVDGRVMASQGLVTVGPAEAGEPSQIPLAFGGVRFDVGEAMAVQVGGLRFDLRPGDSLTLTGSLRTPMLDGTVAAQEGKIRALGTIFDLREGTATFLTHQGLRPAVVAQAETEVGSTRILLTVRGIAPDGLTRELRSDPPKSEAEIMALLGGQVGLTRLLAGDVQGALTVEISRRLFGTAGQAIERALGLNELTITYDFEQPLALRAGKRLVRDLYVAVETTFGVQARWLAALEYRFARDWQLTLRVDSDRRSAAVFWYTTRF
jgi:translocation and assembly module TamB